MKKIDWIIGGIFFGFIFFITCYCVGWFIGAGIGGNAVFIGCALGAAAGIAIDVLFLKKILLNMYCLHPLLLVSVFLLYSVGIFGFFMGVPAFNALLGIATGWYIGRRAKVTGAGHYRKPLTKAVLFSTGVLALFCAASAWLALTDRFTAANLEGMLNLGFRVTDTMIWGIILVGGALLLAFQAAAVAIAARTAVKIG
jgi:hypothetical protein